MPQTIMPRDRVQVFDPRLFENDKSTPISVTVKPATIVQRYGKMSLFDSRYSDLVDVRFDHRPNEISIGHFTELIRLHTLRKQGDDHES